MTMERDSAPLIRIDSCALASARRVAAMLDCDPGMVADGQPLPRGWHFILLGGDTRRSELRGDGFPGLGVPMPDFGLPRLLLAGRSVRWDGDIAIGEPVERDSRIEDITEKQGPAGRMALVRLRHALRPLSQAQAAVIETQTYALLPAGPSAPRPAAPAGAEAAHRRRVTPDETLLFQYSALGFNSHKIHLDRDHARIVEGLPDLVVNGGLVALLATEFLRTDLGVTPTALRARHLSPLYCNHPMTLCADPAPSGWRIRVLDDSGVLAAELEVEA
ncbi:FAS1-like dehydratase domain-containing protein [Paracoccus denitrificans]|jgi:3-methylfumaryl-CoA hydratase|uniref:FAS1-like dehydratase domain-containing protein n=1 Tax=Paracoccus denitrificans (strain Pd 1222) TaxID=318586 RepID=A1AYG6_PARDP|nr:MaoC family dehydratase N-terminal domain-containing protein [Paracoccus denitrificans]ABL68310.1 conserved hypothetical protein [Paracoccus denitrificans PD1222]MBB4627824.1 3-methylfumaryl-CoA hydratase [Paracoccus denitrificans]MCU7428640.1 MaoC family dehydratase N-terminal domain-containing protein [Paracoccus denitrificans]QAR26399.1 hypothetical protein EO213_08870 [Paracoccus denitrificans]UPV95328.1 MaoC family dehydratase N-terminal domain-containing protein [Paracoccus denitrific